LATWADEPADFTDADGNAFHGLKILKIGEPPWMIEDSDVALTIRNHGLKVMTALDTAGYASTQFALTQTSWGVEFRVPPHEMYAVLQ
jgi:hypothetical protein